MTPREQELEQEVGELRNKLVIAKEALRVADDAMFSWFSSEYANSKERKIVMEARSQL